MTTPVAVQLADQMLAEALITPDQYEAAVHRCQATGVRIEDALVDTGAIDETELLKYLARMFRTKFVATVKLSRVDVDRALLETLPRALAEKHLVFPVVYDAASGVLSVVSPDAGDPELGQAVRLATRAREVRVFVARPAAVRAAIAKYYDGDLYAFAHADAAEKQQYMSLLDLYDSKMVSPESLGAAAASTVERPRERVLQPQDFERASRPSAVAPSPVSVPGFLDTVTVLVSLLENSRADLRGHSALAARWIRKLAERIRLSPMEADALATAALVHDLGKYAPYHLTALNVAQYDSHKVIAAKVLDVPLRLFESVPLGETTLAAVRGMYERFDGKGIPDGLSGREIPLGARLLALADTYADLTQNPRNPFRRALSPAEACEALGRYRATVFDPNLLELLRQTATGDDLRARLLADRPVLLLADPDPEESTVLELRLVEQGFDVRSARTVDQARKALEAGDVDVCIAETDLGGASGLDLLAWARTHPWGRSLPWLVLTRDARREAITQAYERGASDYVVKPVPAEVLSAKVKQVVTATAAARAPRGVTGSLSEMGLTDIVQMLGQARKSGQLRVRSGSEQGEIHFVDGAVVNAMWGALRGDEAFFVMIGVAAGDFAFDPTFKPTARVIAATIESLMLEGMRRIDEART